MSQTVLTLGTGSVARAFPAVLKFECGPRAVEGRPRAGRVHYFISQGILKRGRNRYGAVPNQLSLFLSLSLSLSRKCASEPSRKHTQRNSRTPLAAVEGHNPCIKKVHALRLDARRLAQHNTTSTFPPPPHLSRY